MISITRVKAMKILEENTGINLHNSGLDNGFLDKASKTEVTKDVIDKLDFIKSKYFVLQRTSSRK